ncbi:MAG: hypothetical protein ACQEQO_02070 [Thermodesulfobacteriota bacterium]
MNRGADFYEVTGGLRLGEKGAVFSQRISGENRGPRFIGAMRRVQNLSAWRTPPWIRC